MNQKNTISWNFFGTFPQSQCCLVGQLFSLKQVCFSLKKVETYYERNNWTKYSSTSHSFLKIETSLVHTSLIYYPWRGKKNNPQWWCNSEMIKLTSGEMWFNFWNLYINSCVIREEVYSHEVRKSKETYLGYKAQLSAAACHILSHKWWSAWAVSHGGGNRRHECEKIYPRHVGPTSWSLCFHIPMWPSA